MAFNTVGRAPGVYIDEFEPGQPIAGVATNIVGFVGIASAGPINVSRRITSWDGFRAVFGDTPVDGTYLWYAVQGFYQNGGRVCFVVRADGSRPDTLEFNNDDNKASWIATARAVGPQAPAISLKLTRKNRLAGANTQAFTPSTQTVGNPIGREFKVTDAKEAARFRPGDRVLLDAETLLIARVVDDKITVATDPTVAHGNGTAVTLAKTQVGDKTLRVTSTEASVTEVLVPGAILTLKQTAATETVIVTTVQTEFIDMTTAPPTATYRVTVRDGMTQVYDLDPAKKVEVTSEEFEIVVKQDATTLTYPDLSMDSTHSRYFITRVNDDPDGLLDIAWKRPRPNSALPKSLPKTFAANDLAGGITKPAEAADFKEAIKQFERVDLVSLLACPDAVTLARDPSDAAGALVLADVQQALVGQCEKLGDRFAILDSRADAPLNGDGSVENQRSTLTSDRGYGALYYPWLQIMPAVGTEPIAVPPSGHVCGVIARSDDLRGVFKAPANETMRGALGVVQPMNDDDQGGLNEIGINCIRSFAGEPPRLWGARTITTNTNWRYVSTRRLFIYLEESIQEGIRWGVFEPNNLTLWRKLKRSITDFLMRSYRDGALFGEKPEQAFYVRIDEVLNPFSEQQLGRLTIEIGIRPAFPAEFIIVRIGIWAGGSETTET